MAREALGNAEHRERFLGEALLRVKAEQGKANAQFSLGAMYYHGRGVPQE